MAYCRSCANQLNTQSSACLKCGMAAGQGDNYCPNCGTAVNSDVTSCTKCGFTVRMQVPRPAKKEKQPKSPNPQKSQVSTLARLWIEIPLLLIPFIIALSDSFFESSQVPIRAIPYFAVIAYTAFCGGWNICNSFCRFVIVKTVFGILAIGISVLIPYLLISVGSDFDAKPRTVSNLIILVSAVFLITGRLLVRYKQKVDSKTFSNP